uniref:Fibrinogen-like protein A-like n=1 Tax=Saccoglossus kowalevskii TaxID=10224 RepID=A0ABM0MXI0_SACKO
MQFSIVAFLYLLSAIKAQDINSRHHTPSVSQSTCTQETINACPEPRDCYDILHTSPETRESGSYTVQPDDDDEPFRVFCDMQTDSGGWTVFQRRMDGSLDFFRNWHHYASGFGNVNSEFWLGNDKLYRLTHQQTYELRIDMADFDGNTAHAQYDYFRIGDGFSKYKLTLGQYGGDAGDSLSYHRNHSFSTIDSDNDIDNGNCAAAYKGAWWYQSCHHSNLNGPYQGGEHSSYAD